MSKSGELLTLLLTPGDSGADKPSQYRGLQANDRKSSKQPVAGSNPAGGVSKPSFKGKRRARHPVTADVAADAVWKASKG